MILEPGMGYNSEAEMVAQAELPNHLAFLALMPAKNIAVTLIILRNPLKLYPLLEGIKDRKDCMGKDRCHGRLCAYIQAFTVIWLMALWGL